MDLGVEGGMYFYLVLFVYQVQGREVRLWTHFTAETKPRFCFRSMRSTGHAARSTGDIGSGSPEPDQTIVRAYKEDVDRPRLG